MSHTRMSRRSRRSAIVVGGLAAVLLPLGLAGPAVAGTLPAGDTASAAHSAPAEAGTPTAVTEVSEFYDRYIAAVAENDSAGADALRQEKLTADLQDRLTAWERENLADGVLRARNVPTAVAVSYEGSGMGHSWTLVTLKWSGDTDTTQLHVQSDLKSQKLSDIKRLD